MELPTLVSLGFLLLLIVLAGSWTVLPMLYGSPWVPSFERRIRCALKLAQVQPGERVIDLGSGDGRVLVCAAQEFQARAIGYEIEPVHCLASLMRARAGGVWPRVRVHWRDFTQTRWAEADVIFLYLTQGQLVRLQPRLQSQLRAGTRVVSLSSELPGWKPSAVNREQLIFLYQMPPVPGDLLTYFEEEAENNAGRKLTPLAGADGQPGCDAAE